MDSSAQDNLDLMIYFLQTSINQGENMRQTPIIIPQYLDPTAVRDIMSLLDSFPDTEQIELTERFINNVNAGATPYKNVLSEQGEEALRTVEFRNIVNTAHNKACPILQTTFDLSQIVIQLPCNHCFDPAAIKQWVMTEKAECPICRYQLPSKEVKEDESPSFDGESSSSNDERENMRWSVGLDYEEEEIRLAILASLDDYNNYVDER
jgi:hypothetical protein